MKKSNEQIRILGVDTGGTFTDFVFFDGRSLKIHKTPSTPLHPDEAVIQGIKEMGLADDFTLHYGTTVATNAFLERKGARIALLTTEGFEDIVVIGRQNRPDLYALCVRRPEPFVPDECRIGVKERVDSNGEIIFPLEREEIERVKSMLHEIKPEAIAVVFLFSFINPANERMMRDALMEMNLPIFISSEVFPEYREYERTVVTGLNAYLSPKAASHLSRLSNGSNAALRVMSSSGGTITAQQTIRRPIETLLSGPAAGVVAALHLAKLAGFERLITFDMGGTSTDASLIDGKIDMTVEAEFGGLPIRIPMIDIRTIGAGGGSIALIDAGGALKVGPESAGALPGPICYGKGGDRLTVTDANLFLGRIHSECFLGGRMMLSIDPVKAAFDEFGKDLKLSREELAEGIVEVANTNMERVLRSISVERGHDPSDYTIVAFGGAGGLHAADLAERLGVPRVLIPRNAGAISALGAALTDLTKNLTRTALIEDRAADEKALDEAFKQLIAEGSRQFQEDGVDAASLIAERFLFIRYKGQSYEIRVEYDGSLPEAFAQFDRLHEQYYGFKREGRVREIVNVFARLAISTPKPEFPELKAPDVESQISKAEDRIYYRGKIIETAVYDWPSLPPGSEIRGAALLFESTSTALLPPGWIGKIDRFGNIVMEREG